MPNADDLARSIAPGSLPYGERQEVAGNLQAALGGQGGGPAIPAEPEPLGGPVDPEIDPMERLMSGDHQSDLPVTEGLPFGPGGGGPTPISETPKATKLREIAMHAKSPVLRYQARQALRRELRNGR